MMDASGGFSEGKEKPVQKRQQPGDGGNGNKPAKAKNILCGCTSLLTGQYVHILHKCIMAAQPVFHQTER